MVGFGGVYLLQDSGVRQLVRFSRREDVFTSNLFTNDVYIFYTLNAICNNNAVFFKTTKIIPVTFNGSYSRLLN